tara:strand:- start:567 stop:1049 length:483 start_codon:yes stop_codon:yes gene_type:complete
MATITATLNVSSDISEYGVAINKTMTMTKAGSTTGLDKATGLIRKTFTSTNHVDLLVGGASGGIAEDVTKNKAAKLYIKNVGTDSSEYFTIGMGKSSGGGTAEGFDQADSTERFCEIGRLYSGDFLIIPWDAEDTNGYGDITIKPSVATTMVAEYMVFFE